MHYVGMMSYLHTKSILVLDFSADVFLMCSRVPML